MAVVIAWALDYHWTLKKCNRALKHTSATWRDIKPEDRFSKVPKTSRARKYIRNSPTRLFCEAGLFTYWKGNKNYYNYKVSRLQTPSFWRYKENYVTRNSPEKFREFWATGARSRWVGACKSTIFLSGVFTDRFIFRSNFLEIRLLWECHDQS